MIRKLRAYRVPLAMLLAAMLLTAIFSIQIISSNSYTLGYSVTVEVEGLESGDEIQVGARRASSTRWATTNNGVAVFEDLVPGSYTVFTDPNNEEQMAIGSIHVPTQRAVSLRLANYYAVMVSVTGSDAGSANSATVLYNGTQQSTNPTGTLQNGHVTLRAPAGNHRVEIYDRYGAVLEWMDITVSNRDVAAPFTRGTAASSRNDLTVRVKQSGQDCAADITIYDANSNIAYTAWVQNGMAQFHDLKSGRYLIHAEGDGVNTAAYSVVNIPTNRDITLNLTPLQNVRIDVSGSRASRAVYFNYAVSGHRYYNGHQTLNGGEANIPLPAGSYTVYLYDSNKRSLKSQTFRVSNRDITVRVELDSSSSRTSSSSGYYTTNRWSGSASTASRTTTVAGSLSRDQADSAARAALNDAKSEGLSTVTIRLKDVGSATRTNLRSLTENTGDRPVKVYADSMRGGAVDVRITFDPAQVDRALNLHASTTDSRAAGVQRKFENWYGNRIRVIAMGHQEAWGQPVQIAAQVKLDQFDTSNLCLYTYNASTNSYKRIADPGDWIDSQGYLHLTTERGGDIVISNGPLKK